MIYQVAEKFKSLQGEGLYAGTPMAFIRFVGCSVGKKTCHACDTDFEKMHNWRGGGEYTESQLLEWSDDYAHICLTGGEPLNQDLAPLISLNHDIGHRWDPKMLHIETSGTVPYKFLGQSALEYTREIYVCVSPKPGYLDIAINDADEVKIIVPGLGSGKDWPQLADALRWAQAGKNVYLQPRNGKFDVDQVNLKYVLDLLAEYPTLRLSVQMHKILKVQ